MRVRPDCLEVVRCLVCNGRGWKPRFGGLIGRVLFHLGARRFRVSCFDCNGVGNFGTRTKLRPPPPGGSAPKPPSSDELVEKWKKAHEELKAKIDLLCKQNSTCQKRLYAALAKLDELRAKTGMKETLTDDASDTHADPPTPPGEPTAQRNLAGRRPDDPRNSLELRTSWS